MHAPVSPPAGSTPPALTADMARLAWRARLTLRTRSGAGPIVRDAEGCVADAAALHAGAERWQATWRAAGLRPGDRVVLALPPGADFIAALVAAFRDGLTLALAPAGDAAALERVVDEVDARLAIAPVARAHVTARPARFPPTPDARVLLRTSGTTADARWIACSDANLLAVVDSHAEPLALRGATLLSVLPWHHAFGLVIELLPALLAGATIVRDPLAGRAPDALPTFAAALAPTHPITHLSAVPHTMRRLVAHDASRALLARLRGGVVGGAPVDAALAEQLMSTRLRVGYGQTEASPGVLLGEAGVWHAGTLGRPLDHRLACAVRLGDDGELAFRGPNACLGTWTPEAGLARHDPERWVATGDLARIERDGTYTFEGRTADAFKLANGRFVGAAALERAVRARYPALVEAMLSSPDGERLVLACTPAAGTSPPAADELAPMLGALAARLSDVVTVRADDWVRTAKGELDRRWPQGAAGRGSAA